MSRLRAECPPCDGLTHRPTAAPPNEPRGARFPEGNDRAALVQSHEVSGGTGAVLVAYEEGRPVGCAALRRLEPGVGEIRHVWVHPDARRLGLARRLLAELEWQAVKRGYGVVRLDTHASLSEAQAMYRACGYTEIPRCNDDVYGAYWFEKSLEKSP